MGRLFDKWFWVLVVGYILFQAFAEFSEPALEAETAGETYRLPASLPIVSLEGPGHRRGNAYIGTAFAVGGDDDWITARHVTAGCKQLSLLSYRGGNFVDRAAVKGNVLHNAADVARIDSGRSFDAALPLVSVRDIGPPVEAWGHGFPQGESAWVSLRFLAPVAVEDPRSGTALGAVWHVDRYPSLPIAYDLGGLSGGPLLDSSGTVRGIIVGSDPRRSRLVTIDPIYAAALSDAETLPSKPGPTTYIPTERDIALKRAGLVRMVDCRS